MERKLKFVSPLLVVDDIQKSRAFYETVLGLNVIADFGENITFEGNFSLHQKKHFHMLIDGKEITMGGNDFEIYFEYDDVEQFNNKLLKMGVRLVHPMREQPWRQKVVRFYDPDHHIIEVGESMEYLCFRLHNEKLTIQQISEISMMPFAFVEASIEKYN